MVNRFKDLYRVWALPDSQTALRINWFGEISFPNRSFRRLQPSLRIYLSPVSDPLALKNQDLLLDPKSTASGRFSIPRYISVGCLPFLRIGDIWQQQKLLLEPDYQVETFPGLQINNSTTTLIKAGLSRNGKHFLIPLEDHPWHRDCTRSYCIAVKLRDGRQAIVPCMELIRFYFGSSSSIMGKLFSPTLRREDLYSEYQFEESSRKLTLKLAEGIYGAAAADIGRICLNPVAWRAAASIGASLLELSASGQPAFPKTYFPFEGVTDLSVTGKWISFAGVKNSTFIVFRLRSCTHRFPFSSLKYELQKPREQGVGSEYSSDKKRYIGAASRDDPERKVVEQDASNRLAEKTYELSTEHRFPDLAKKPIWKHKESEGTFAADIAQRKGILSPTQAAVGANGTAQPVRPIELEMKQGKEFQLTQFMREVAAQLRDLDGINFRLVTSGGDDGWTVPASQRLYEEWLHIDAKSGGKRLRRIGAFHISLAAKSVFLVLVEAEPAIPFFIEMPQSSESKLVSIATRQFILWKSRRVADSDPFGIDGLQRITDGALLQPVVRFVTQSLRLPTSS